MACLWSKEENKQVCGGFLVHKRFVMTAAHCISDLSDIRVVLGVQNWKKPEPCWQTFEKVTPYFSNYNKRSYENDIVLLKLHRSATLDKSVNLLPLPGNDWDIPEGTVCNVAGWGKTTLNGQQSSDLREVNVTILSNEHCASALELNHIAKTRLCAGLKGKAKDAYEKQPNTSAGSPTPVLSICWKPEVGTCATPVMIPIPRRAFETRYPLRKPYMMYPRRNDGLLREIPEEV
ncbi:granzyme K-like isoform X1 [Ambystoma mexicanum]|uniref:granzyme K-like isoform X1 n=1 Tax=Ambystoma mexicanum TaxID=8296 RepID=UPI0037E73F59